MVIKSKKSVVRKTSSKTTKLKRAKTICISHMEDADGISSAALIKQAFGGDTILVDYPGMIDALETLSYDPVAYLIFPRVIAGIIMFPILIIIADFFGILGGLIACITTLEMNAYQFIKGAKEWFNPWDAQFGLIKATCFGYAITSIGCYFGYYTRGGAQGVGKATTSTVVASCVSILILDVFLAERFL